MDNNVKPKVSVTICSYNRANMISRAINSVFEQTYENIEIIVVDDASTDNTEGIVRTINGKYPIKYFKNLRNLNIAGTRNRTINESSGKYIAILDSDDYWIDKNKIQKQVELLEKNPNCALVGSHAIIIDEHDNQIGEIKNLINSLEIKTNLLRRNEFVHSTVLYRKNVLNEFGQFDVKMSPFEDYDLILKIGRKYDISNLDLISTAYRVHAQGESKKLNLKKKLKLLKILIKNSLYYPGFINAISRRLFK